jgi:hypothetical protein
LNERKPPAGTVITPAIGEIPAALGQEQEVMSGAIEKSF